MIRKKSERYPFGYPAGFYKNLICLNCGHKGIHYDWDRNLDQSIDYHFVCPSCEHEWQDTHEPNPRELDEDNF